jgi:hypothetical protein
MSSVLSPQVHTELSQLLLALQSGDNNIRSQAEEHLANNWTNTQPEDGPGGADPWLHRHHGMHAGPRGMVISVGAFSWLMLGILDALICFSYLPSHSFKDSQGRERRPDRAVPIYITRAGLCDPREAARGARQRDRQHCAEQGRRCCRGVGERILR